MVCAALVEGRGPLQGAEPLGGGVQGDPSLRARLEAGGHGDPVVAKILQAVRVRDLVARAVAVEVHPVEALGLEVASLLPHGGGRHVEVHEPAGVERPGHPGGDVAVVVGVVHQVGAEAERGAQLRERLLLEPFRLLVLRILGERRPGGAKRRTRIALEEGEPAEAEPRGRGILRLDLPVERFRLRVAPLPSERLREADLRGEVLRVRREDAAVRLLRLGEPVRPAQDPRPLDPRHEVRGIFPDEGVVELDRGVVVLGPGIDARELAARLAVGRLQAHGALEERDRFLRPVRPAQEGPGAAQSVELVRPHGQDRLVQGEGPRVVLVLEGRVGLRERGVGVGRGAGGPRGQQEAARQQDGAGGLHHEGGFPFLGHRVHAPSAANIRRRENSSSDWTVGVFLEPQFTSGPPKGYHPLRLLAHG